MRLPYTAHFVVEAVFVVTATPSASTVLSVGVVLTQPRHGVRDGARARAVQDAHRHNLGLLGHPDLQANGGGRHVGACKGAGAARARGY